MEWGYGAPGPLWFWSGGGNQNLNPGGHQWDLGLTLVQAIQSIDTIALDWGHGDPFDDNDPPDPLLIDTGFGSPYYDNVEAIGVFGNDPPYVGTYPDHGGYLVRVTGAWNKEQTVRVRLFDKSGAPHPSAGYCYSGVMGKGDAIKPVDQKYFEFVLPPLKPGTYDMKFYIEPDESGIEVKDALRIVPRNRSTETFNIRNGFPLQYKVGPGDIQRQPTIKIEE